MPTTQIPLFPLSSILLPYGRMPLQIFEPRYLDLVRDCLRNNRGFGVVWIRQGGEVARAGRVRQQLMTVGTVAHIVDADQLPNGLLGVTIEGRGRFDLQSTRVANDGLVLGQICLQEPLPPTPGGQHWPEQQTLLERLLRHPEVRQLGMAVDPQDPWQLGFALAQLLPFPQADKYTLLLAQSSDDLMDKLELMLDALHRSAAPD